MTPEQLDAETLDLINKEIASRLDRQSDSIAKIDTKAGLVIGYTLAAASFLATRHTQPVLTALAFAAFAVAVVCGLGALAVWNYQDIKPMRLLSYAASRPATALSSLIARRVMIFKINGRRQWWKAVLWWISLAALLVGTALMVTAVQTYQDERADQRGRPASVHRILSSGSAKLRHARPG